MATLEEWTLPLNPPNPNALYLQYLTPEQNGRLFYTKYILDIIGELNIRREGDNVREWVVPSSLHNSACSQGDPIGIVYGPENQVWFAMESGHCLVEFDPDKDLFKAYGGNSSTRFPIRWPRHLMSDKHGNVWYTGAGSQGALIGMLNADRRSVVYWDLERIFITPEGIWVDSDGKGVWFTPINHNYGLTGAYLAHLDTSENMLTYWMWPSPGRNPRNPGVVGEPATQPENIWFTYSGFGGPSSRVYRLNIRSDTF